MGGAREKRPDGKSLVPRLRMRMGAHLLQAIRPTPDRTREERSFMRSRLIAWGEFFFRQRSWTPIPFMVILLVCRINESPNRLTWLPGLVLIAMGEGLRLWGVAVVGKGSRTRGHGVERFVTHGPYAYVRNPLYLGNLFLTLGVTCISRLLWMVPIAFALFLVQYVPIVLWEERILAQRFADQYASYCHQVPRWIPLWRPQLRSRAPASYQWRASLWSERSTLGTLLVLLLIMIAKARRS